MNHVGVDVNNRLNQTKSNFIAVARFNDGGENVSIDCDHRQDTNKTKNKIRIEYI
jgi:hypothetical protein